LLTSAIIIFCCDSRCPLPVVYHTARSSCGGSTLDALEPTREVCTVSLATDNQQP
jgi:hypothetical protein